MQCFQKQALISKVMIDKLNGCIEDDDVSEKFNSIWDKVNADIKKESDSEPAYNKYFSTIKTESYDDEITNFL